VAVEDDRGGTSWSRRKKWVYSRGVKFEADEGWMPVNTLGRAWRYRARGVAGVVMIFLGDDGKRTYEATHNDSSGKDSELTTRVRRKAAWFAMRGTKKGLPERPRYPRAPLPEVTVVPSESV
jgi:hypothetical protein